MNALERTRLLDMAAKALARSTQDMFYSDDPILKHRERRALEEVELAKKLIFEATGDLK